MYRHKLTQLELHKEKRLAKLRTQSLDQPRDLDFRKLFKQEYDVEELAGSIDSGAQTSPSIIQDIASHLHSSRLLSNRIGKYEEESEDELFPLEEEEEQEEEEPYKFLQTEAKSPLINQIKILALKYGDKK